MRNVLRLVSLLTVAIFLSNCSSRNSGSDPNRSRLTGWNFNDPNYGGYLRGENKGGNKLPLGMVYIEGGTFTMGAVQDDVMFDWNTTPRQVHVRSFYMDETEVTNAEYGLFVQYIRSIYPPEKNNFKNIYNAVLPDTLVWRQGLGNTEILSENYFRHPAYADYPVVGVSWKQANQYCKWRTNAVNLKKLMDKGIMKNIFREDSIKFEGKNSFDTDAYLADPYALFDGDTAKVYNRGLSSIRRGTDQSRSNRSEFTGRHVTVSDGVLDQEFRLPTEAEWEFAAKATFQNREYNNIRGRKKYAWDGKYTRDRSKKHRGDQLANFKQGKGNYSGIPGWSSDGSDIPNRVRSYPPNAFGLYDMSGNVAEWVKDVYRPIIDSEANDFNYFRGNIFTKKMIDKDGKVVIVGNEDVVYDTLPNGKIVPKDLPGSVRYIPITKDQIFMRRNYAKADNIALGDGDVESSKSYNLEDEQLTKQSRMYNSPVKPVVEKKYKDTHDGNGLYQYDAKRRTTLISDKSRVYKGGSWADREYWLDPSQRRYYPEYMATNYIGFRCATDKVGPLTFRKERRRTPVYSLRRRK